MGQPLGAVTAALRRALAADGPLAAALPGYTPRPGQTEMAEAVAAAVTEGGTLLCEAGTGTGKTIAYLVPALLAGRRVIVSTATRALQEQVFARELARLARALGWGGRTVLLKGRSNYLCPHRAAQALAEGRFATRAEAQALAAIGHWASRTVDGDIAEIAAVPEDSPVWPRVTSTVDNCLGGDCPELARCFVQRARRAAQEADLVVVNHHLLAADLALRREGFGDLLPEVDACIVDEAHHFPDIAADRLGEGFSARQLRELARDAVAEARAEAAGDGELEAQALRLVDAVETAARAVVPDARVSWAEARRTALEDGLRGVLAVLGELRDALDGLAGGGPGLVRSRERACRLEGGLRAFLEDEEDGTARWVEGRAGFVCHRTPVETGSLLPPLLAAMAPSWVFVSATLTVAGEFGHFARRLGVAEYEARAWPSPYDHRRQALLCVPEGLPDPGRNAGGHTEAVIAVARRVIAAARGRTFVLFTSRRALQRAAEALRGTLAHPLLVQGDGPRGRLVARFRELGDAVLLGTATFWEGVDVKGPALSAVVIDRLPFASPGDPLTRARARALAEAGEDPFRALHLPRAVIALRQGLGRLIRDEADRGVVVVCDPRLVERSYGRVFLDSLPEMRLTRRLEEVERFFAAERVA